MRLAEWLVLAAVVCLTAGVFHPVLEADFINFDDDQYVTGNPVVQRGLDRESLRWAFTTREAANWHPLAWLSHMLDVEWHGLDPRGHHLTSLLLHLASAALLFTVLRGLTGRPWPGAFAAALFAVHPLHVESVAWVAERKDVLSAFFSLLALWAYSRYAGRPATGRYLTVLGLFSLGLMAKPMAITLPLLLLLLDYWPLGRLFRPWGELRPRGLSDMARPLLEKVPLLVLSAGSAAITLQAQRSGGAVQDEIFPFSVRLANALVTCVQYLWRTVWPRDLAVFYPHPGDGLPWLQAAGAGALLFGGSVAFLRARRDMPFLAVGWLWYLVTLVPVIGLVQVGRQGMADRYTYVPLIGVFLMVSWVAPALLRGWRGRGRALALAALLALSALAACTHLQAGSWRDSLTLFTRALRTTRDNWLAEYNVGLLLSGNGDAAGAAVHYRNALRIRPDYAEAHNNLGGLLAAERRFEEAAGHFREALRRQPLMSRLPLNRVYVNLGNVLLELGRTAEAANMYQQARRIDPGDATPVYCLAVTEAGRGNRQRAESLYREALRLKPDYPEAVNNLAILLVGLGRPEEAADEFERLLELRPDFEAAHFNIARIFHSRGMLDRAVVHYRESLRLNPDNREAGHALEQILRRGPPAGP